FAPISIALRFPYTTLFRSLPVELLELRERILRRVRIRVERRPLVRVLAVTQVLHLREPQDERLRELPVLSLPGRRAGRGFRGLRDRKSTRLNSSHVKISYS